MITFRTFRLASLLCLGSLYPGSSSALTGFAVSPYFTLDTIVDVAQSPDFVRPIELTAGSPNPFNLTARFTVQIGEDQTMNAAIYDLTGRLIKPLLHGAPAKAGSSLDLYWDGRDGNGRALSSGVYYCRVTAGGYTASTPITLVK